MLMPKKPPNCLWENGGASSARLSLQAVSKMQHFSSPSIRMRTTTMPISTGSTLGMIVSFMSTELSCHRAFAEPAPPQTLYRALFQHSREADHDWVVCEVNIDPPNPGSDAFHEKMGFVEVGRTKLADRDKTVRYLGLQGRPGKGPMKDTSVMQLLLLSACRYTNVELKGANACRNQPPQAVAK